ncbi:hypothetical protein M4578_23480 [Salipiger sp. P9]|uniref:DUF6966 domain-containing protein n=1 Tax=Salipiger pentaromativorans TaxID=2943193 RepID=UPI0021584887|nr:hypothetical protein [Salipiger pentaromativorans]MCR8550798.1 hypothetical protein [Salipiger pentaromativorans]
MAQDLSNLHPDVQEFVQCLQRIRRLLVENHERFWCLRIEKVIQLARKSDGYSVELFLGFFGGMGSFDDLVLDTTDVANSDLRKEKTKAYQIAQNLR